MNANPKFIFVLAMLMMKVGMVSLFRTKGKNYDIT